MKKKNTNILKKAIAELPEFRLNNPEIWPGIEDVLGKDTKYSTKLPEYKAPENLWQKIEEKLAQQNPNLTNAIQNMPLYKAPVNTWEKIEHELDKNKRIGKGKELRLLIRISAAAILVLSVGVGLWLRFGNKNTELERLQVKNIEIHQNGDGIESIYNPALCKSNPQICNTDLFKSLDKELNEIKTEIETMKPMIKGNDPQLMKYYYRLENEKAEIEKRLVKIIMQS